METNQATLDQTHFRYLREEEIENPYGFIKEFCKRETDLYYFKEDVLNLLKSAYSYREEFYAGVCKNYTGTQIQIIKVVEAMYILYCNGEDLTPGNSLSYENSYNCLGKEECMDPMTFLKDFFDHNDLEKWREFLDEMLIHAYKEGGVGYFEYDETPFKNIQLLEKLTEAIFLVHEIHSLKENYPKASGDTEEGTIDEDVVEEVVGGKLDSLKIDQTNDDAEQPPMENGILYPELSERLEKAIIKYFSMIDPRFAGNCFRRILLDALEHNIHEDRLSSSSHDDYLIFPFSELFALLDIAEQETADWEQDRFGCDLLSRIN